MKNRDKHIIGALEKFKVLERDQIADMFFSNLKHSVTNCNYALRRLRDRGYIDCDTSKTPYQYFSKPSTIKKGSQKIEHYLKIAQTFIDMVKFGEVEMFEIEPYWKNVDVIPDVIAFWNKSYFAIEVQNSFYSVKQMKDKLDKYQKLYTSGGYKELPWQPKNNKYFPHVLIIGKTNSKYNFDEYSFRVFQYESVSKFIEIEIPQTNKTETTKLEPQKKSIYEVAAAKQSTQPIVNNATPKLNIQVPTSWKRK
ncbi:replication-relaxation family protein [Sutcliffiella cohnii]|uniref:replication-relaxation family protein n=1 Tax=Sutcliffiella cohnii TaxID=33932 RepID=UPI002E249503|nr:replication-relaxation family protein [Sutcliffiella cohnii]